MNGQTRVQMFMRPFYFNVYLRNMLAVAGWRRKSQWLWNFMFACRWRASNILTLMCVLCRMYLFSTDVLQFSASTYRSLRRFYIEQTAEQGKHEYQRWFHEKQQEIWGKTNSSELKSSNQLKVMFTCTSILLLVSHCIHNIMELNDAKLNPIILIGVR